MHHFLFQILPYIALGVLILGSIARYERDPFTWKTSSSQLLRRKQLMLGSVLFHVGVLIVFVGHFVGLLTPIWVFDALGISHGAKQFLAAFGGGIAGIAALIGALILLHRRLTDPRILATSSVADTTILAILTVQLALGMGTVVLAMDHLDGHVMTLFMAWALGIFTFDGQAASYIEGTHWIYRAHIVLGLIIFILFPFTRLVHMLSIPVRYVTLRKGYQVVRARDWAPTPPPAIPAANAALGGLARTLTGKPSMPQGARSQGRAPGFVGLALTPLTLVLRGLDAIARKLAGSASRPDAPRVPVQTPAE